MHIDDIESKNCSAECADEIDSCISNLEVDEVNEKEAFHEHLQVHEKTVQEGGDEEEHQEHQELETSEEEPVDQRDGVSLEIRGATSDVEAQLVATDSEQTLATEEDDLANLKDITEIDTVAEVVYPTEHQFLIMQLNIKTAANNLPAPPIGKPSILNLPEFDETFPSGSVKAITAAVSNLIHCASRVQVERSSNKVQHVESATKQLYFSDGTWTQGLISAAKQVAAATTELCKISSEQSNEAGETTHDAVIVSAKSISAATAHLLASATSGITNPSSQSQVALKAAGKAVLAAVDDFINNLPIITVEDIHPPTSTTTNSIRGK
ncbi:Talin-1, partial [Rhizoclosmatium hyalinum]